MGFWFYFNKIAIILFEIYLLTIDLSYIYFKHIKKDIRFEKVGLFKYFDSPIKTLKGKM